MYIYIYICITLHRNGIHHCLQYRLVLGSAGGRRSQHCPCGQCSQGYMHPVNEILVDPCAFVEIVIAVWQY